jgi:putative transposase
MTSTTIAELLEDLSVTSSLSRPRVSDDNPYSEAAFKTVKYRPSYPDRFDSIEHARAWMRERSSAGTTLSTTTQASDISTRHDLHNGTAESVIDARQEVLDAAYQAHPERFIAGPPKAARPQPQRGSTSQPSKQKARSTGNNHLTASGRPTRSRTSRTPG